MLGAIRFLYMFKSVWAVVAALIVGSFLIKLAGSDPIEAYVALFKGAFTEYYGVGSTLVKMSPLVLAGLAVTVPLRAGQFNIGVEGQIYMGALFATLAALYLPAMPGWLHILAASLSGMIGGAFWALIPAILKAYYRVNEIIVTLLMNYVAINIVSYAVSGPMMAPDAPYPYSHEIPEALFLPHVLPRTDAHLGVVIGIVLAIVIFAVFRYGTFGFTLSTVGKNARAAEYAGVSVRRTIVLAFVVAGAMGGLAGTYEVLGLKYRLFHHFSPGYGYDGIVITFLAGANPLFVVIAATFLAGLRSGAGIMQRAVGVDATVIEAIQGLVVIFVAMGLAFRFDRTYWAKFLHTRRAADRGLAPGSGGDKPP
ncbi:MAG: ABC transporter permease [Alphaproteobacteria bacterium]|nr:ABC transporter permease [Alphaproteobacteria bacterium]